ncbi:MAG: DMT family transporter, partial [Pseudomonadales bacterium]|nr:DMT family transporter [Pseudomonadales bacterium]
MSTSAQLEQRRWINTGWLLALVSAALFALRPVLVKLVYAEGVDSTSLLAWRMLFSAPIYLLMLALLLSSKRQRSRITRNAVLASAAVGVVGYFGASWFDLLGLQYVSAQLGRMILYTYPGFVVLIGVIFMAQRIESKTILALALTYAGVAVIFAHDLGYLGDAVVRGALLISAASLCFACYLVFSKRLVETLGSRLFTCIALLSASAVIIFFAASQGLLGSAQLPAAR